MANNKIKVSEATVAKLRKGTMAGNLAKAKSASPEMREALVRFYGAKRVAAAIGKSGPGSIPKPKPFTPGANIREDRKPDRSPKPTGGPGAKPVKVSPPKGGPGSKPLPSKGQTPNQREGRKTLNSPKPSGGPGAKSTRPGAPKGGPGAKSRPSKGQTPNQREGRKTMNSPKPMGGPGSRMPKAPRGGPGARGR